MDSYIFSILYKRIHFSIPLNRKWETLQYTEWAGNTPNMLPKYCVPDVKTKKSLNRILYYIVDFLD